MCGFGTGATLHLGVAGARRLFVFAHSRVPDLVKRQLRATKPPGTILKFAGLPIVPRRERIFSFR